MHSLTEHFCVLDYHLGLFVCSFVCFSLNVTAQNTEAEQIWVSTPCLLTQALKRFYLQEPAGCEVDKEIIYVSSLCHFH